MFVVGPRTCAVLYIA